MPLPLYLVLALLFRGLRFGLHLPLNLDARVLRGRDPSRTLAFSLRTVGLSSIFVGSPCAVENYSTTESTGVAAPDACILNIPGCCM